MDDSFQALLGDRYLLERKLGQGGMGSVYLATDRKVGRSVAIKRISGNIAPTAEALERFRLETETTARTQHPHIVQVLDVGLGQSPYMVLEALTGNSLQEQLRLEPRLSVARACLIATQVLHALEAAHRLLVVHRDIKPANIFLVETPPPGVFVKVLDFGVARLLSQERITHAGDAVGSAYYMSPEQHRGLEVDGRSDIFSVGVVLYEMLAGHRPFRGATPESGIAQMMSGAPPAPIPNCPPELDLQVRRALSIHQGERFPSAHAMAAAIQPFLPRITQEVQSSYAGLTSSRDPVHSLPTARTTTSHTQMPATSPGAFPAAHPSRPSRSLWPLGLLAFAVIGVGAAGAAYYWSTHADEPSAVRTDASGAASTAPTATGVSAAETLSSEPAASLSVARKTAPGAKLSSLATDAGSRGAVVDAGMASLDAGKTAALDAGMASGATIGAACSKPGPLGKGMACTREGKVACNADASYCASASACVRLSDDEQHCGKCDNVCKQDERCSFSKCESCRNNPFAGMCGGVCTPFGANPNCGGCNVRCGYDEMCIHQNGVFRCNKIKR